MKQFYFLCFFSIFLVACTPEDIYNGQLHCKINNTREIIIQQCEPIISELEYTNSEVNFQMKPTGKFLNNLEPLSFESVADTNYFRIKSFDTTTNSITYSATYLIILSSCEVKNILICSIKL